MCVWLITLCQNYGQSPPPSLSPPLCRESSIKRFRRMFKRIKALRFGEMSKRIKAFRFWAKCSKESKELRFENVLSKPTKELSWILCHLSWHHTWQGSAPVTHLRAHKFSNFCVNVGGRSWRFKKRRKSEILHLPVASSLYHSSVPMDKIMIDSTQF